MPSAGFDGDYLSALKIQDQLATWRGLAQKINLVGGGSFVAEQSR